MESNARPRGEISLSYHMFFGFDLGPDVDEAAAWQALDDLTQALIAADVLLSTAPVAKRQHHPVLDTATHIASAFFTTMTFKDKAQADAAVKLIYAKSPDTDDTHNAFIDLVKDPFFLCFDDIPCRT